MLINSGAGEVEQKTQEKHVRRAMAVVITYRVAHKIFNQFLISAKLCDPKDLNLSLP